MSKVECKDCGVLILKDTADSNDGLCMVCARGQMLWICPACETRLLLQKGQYEHTCIPKPKRDLEISGFPDSEQMNETPRESEVISLDLRDDIQAIRSALASAVSAVRGKSPKNLSAIQVGFDCLEGGWVYIGTDQRPEYIYDGDWTLEVDGSNTISVPHWVEANDAACYGDVALTKYDGRKLLISSIDDVGESSDDPQPLVQAIGEFIYELLMAAKSDGIFEELKRFGNVQLVIDDFNGAWGWPKHDDPSKENLT